MSARAPVRPSLPREIVNAAGQRVSLAEIQAQIALNFARAEGTTTTPSEVQARALLFGLRAILVCPSCAAGLPCAFHGASAFPELAPAPRGASGNAAKQKVPGYAETIDVYFKAFKLVRGEDPPFGAREGKAVLGMLEKLDAERAQRAIRACFEDPWHRNHASILTIAKDPARFLGEERVQTKASMTAQRAGTYRKAGA